MDFRPLPVEEQKRLRDALRGNAERGEALRMDAADTSWTPAELAEHLAEGTVINAIRSVPCHYASYTLDRTGKPQLQFEGDLSASATSNVRVNGGPLESRWHEISLYRTTSSKWVWQVCYRSCWQGEPEHDRAEVAASDKAVIDALTIEYDPLAYHQGYPPGEHYAERNARQRDAIRLGYQRAVSEILAEAGLVEEVE